jgi:hypothetical protein
MTSNHETKTSVIDEEKSLSREPSNVDTAFGTVIEIDPAKEAAVRHKFDRYVLPVTFVFMILAVLDRNNVCNA